MKKSLLAGKLQKDKTPNEITPEQVEQMHRQVLSKTVSTEKTIMAEPASTVEEKVQKVRLSIDVTKETHKKMKKRIADTEQTLIEYVVQLIDRDLE
jgi:hypothetical protein